MKGFLAPKRLMKTDDWSNSALMTDPRDAK